MSKHIRWELLSWEIISDLVKNPKSIVILPIGSVEQHGPHLPLGTDFLIADKVAELLAEELNDVGIPAVKFPTLPFGLSRMWSAYPGTITLGHDTFANLVMDLLKNIVVTGFNNVLVLNAHAGNSDMLKVIAREVVEDLGKGKIAVITIWEFIGDLINTVFKSPFFHADEVETSIALALGIPLIKDSKSVRGSTIFRVYNERWHSLDLTKRPKAYVFRPESRVMHGLGAYGKPDEASKESGETLLRNLINRLKDFVIDLIEDRV